MVKRRTLLTSGVLAVVSGAGCINRFSNGDNNHAAEEDTQKHENESIEANESSETDDGSQHPAAAVHVIRMDLTTDTVGATAAITMRNITSETIHSIDVEVTFYDHIDTAIGSSIGGVTDVPPDEKVEITVHAEGPRYTDAAAYEITNMIVE